jgi:general secretion pathway protein K
MQGAKSTRTRYPSKPDKSGMVLIIVLLVIAVLTAVIFEFAYDVRLGYHLAENSLSSYQALYCAQAGLAVATAALEQYGGLWTDEKVAGILSGGVPLTVGVGHCTTSVVGERGKLNVNGLVGPDGKPVRSRIDQMLRLIDVLNAQRGPEDRISYGLVAAIIDWIDLDDQVTVLPFVQGANAGAESEYYRELEKPYYCKNRPLDALGELLLVKGMTREIFSGRTDPGREAPLPGMSEYLTVYGDGMVNINDASIPVLQTLSEQMDLPLAESIVRNRPYRTLDELTQVPGMTPDVLRVIRTMATVRPGGEYYTMTARGVVGQCVRTVRLAVRKDAAGGRVTPLMRWEM